MSLHSNIITGEDMTQDEIIEMARQCGFERLGHDDCDLVCYPEEVEAFAKLVAQHEREACAKVCEQTNDGTPYNLAEACAEAIRARGQS
jgi:hypothetical protein